MVRAILGSVAGKIGLALLFILVAVSIIVPLIFPKDFGSRIWNNPAHWAEYPKVAAPAWTVWFDDAKTRHQIFASADADNIVIVENEYRKVLEYRFTVGLSPKTDPAFLAFSVSGVRFYETSPVITVFLEHSDQRVFLYRHVVPGKAAGESSSVSRYSESPLRVQITSDFGVERTVYEFLDNVRRKGAGAFTAVLRVDFEEPHGFVEEARFVAGGEAFGWLGTDNVGRDIAQGILFGSPIALLVGVSVAFFVTLLGAIVGAVSGYAAGTKLDTFIQRAIDVIASIPTLPIIIFLVFAVGAKLSYIILLLIIFGWTGLAIMIRPMIMQIREAGFIALARAQGFSAPRIIFRHLLMQTMPYLLVNFVFMVPGAILAEAGLSFLGLGDPSIPTWGFMLQQGFHTGAVYLGYWWWVLAPGTAIVLASLVFALIKHALEPYVEPRLNKFSGAGKGVRQ